eukprot:TRINITY_DN6042_c1_g1_i4.p1 TRINITY_DN6042_c1_g1~~TRINITY_DN6042_c1_g1_i4.p1  ORF type:complete len:480 (+),score=74.73 TRINITY_DN6042_c1_g1_i4:289-1728(+)
MQRIMQTYCVRKKQEIVEAINKMQAEIEDQDKISGKYEQLDRRAQELQKEVQALQAQFSDYNMVLDQTQTMQKPQKLQEQLQSLESKNEVERNRVEEIFSRRTDSEQKLGQLENQAQQMNQRMEELLGSMSLQSQREYHQLLQQYQSLQEDKRRLTVQKHQLEQAINEAELEVVTQPNRKKLLDLQRETDSLNQQVQKVESDQRQKGGNLEEQLQNVTQEVKQINAEVQENEQLIRALKKELRSGQKRVSDTQSRISETSETGGELLRLDESSLDDNQRTMFRFINEYDTLKSERMEKMSDLQSQILSATEALADAQETADVVVGGDEVFNSKEIDKLQELSIKVTEEMNELEQKLEKIQDECKRISDLEGLKQEFSNKRILMEQDRSSLQSQTQDLQVQLDAKQRRLKEINDAFKGNSQYSQIDKMDEKVQKLKKNNDQIRSFIKSRIEQTDYEAIVEDLESMADDINQQLMNQVMAF